MSGSTDPGPAANGSRPINWGLTATVFFLGSVLLWADRTNFSVAAAAWAKDYGWTPSTIGMMLSAFSLGYLILQPIGGWIADKFGPRRTLAGSMAGWSLWVLMTPIAPTVLWLTATFRVLLGAFEGPYIPAQRRRRVARDPLDRQARQVRRLRAVRRAAWAGGRRLLRRRHPEHHRLADLHFRNLRRWSGWSAPPRGGATPGISPIPCRPERMRKRTKPRSGPRNRRCRIGS